MRSILSGALLAFTLALPVVAQGLDLGKRGGAVPGNAAFPLQGPAGQPFLLLFATREQRTPLPTLGVTLDLPLDLLTFCSNAPGFSGVFPAGGEVEPTLALPDLPALEGLTLSFQALGGTPLRTSNLVRVSPQRPGTFLAGREQPGVPIVGGGHAAAADGTLLFVGGAGPVAQRYDPRREEWSAAGASFGVGLLAQTTALDDGRVLFTGGIGLDGQPTAAAAVYDPATQQTTTLSMTVPRAGHGAARLGDGRVLITGGVDAILLQDPLAMFQAILRSSEFYDPATDRFTPGPDMLEARALHSASSLRGGEVLIAGGIALLPIINVPAVSATAYRFDPQTGNFGLPALMNGARMLHSAVGLDDGRVLLAGGLTLDLSTFLQTGQLTDIVIGTRSDVQLYRRGLFGFGTFTTVDGMQEGRAGAAIAPLSGGGALIAGGFRLTIDVPTQTFAATATASADRFVPGPDRIEPTGAMAAPRLFPITAPLADGTVMVLGGGPAPVEIYQR